MKKVIAVLIFIFFSFLLLPSCVTNKNAAYFSTGKNDTTRFFQEPITNNFEPVIQPNDILGINVTSPYTDLSNQNNINMFNMPLTNVSGTVQNAMPGQQQNNTTNTLTLGGYRVDDSGNIVYPLVGNIHLAGLTTEEAKNKITSLVSSYVKEPVVDVRFLNYKITVLGEVTHPGTFTVPTERVSILDALGLAGDMTIYGKRDNVLIIREENGERTLARVDLNSKKIFDSPYFYLHQGDVVYVEPNKAKIATADATLRYLPYISLFATLLYTGTLIYVNTRKP